MGVLKSRRIPAQCFWHCVTFFSNIWFFAKGSLFNCDKNVDNSRSVPLLARQGLALAGPGVPHGLLFSVFRFSSTVNWHLEVLLLFLSLGYDADLGRSRPNLINQNVRDIWKEQSSPMTNQMNMRSDNLNHVESFSENMKTTTVRIRGSEWQIEPCTKGNIETSGG